MNKIVLSLIVLLGLLTFSAFSSQEDDAIKRCLEAMSKTKTGKVALSNLERKLYIDRIPKEIKDLGPVLQVIVNKRISIKWTF